MFMNPNNVTAGSKKTGEPSHSIAPVKKDFWDQFRSDFGWIMHINHKGNYTTVIEKTIEVALKVINYSHEIRDSSSFQEVLIDDLVDKLEPLLDKLKQAMYQSVDIGKGKHIGIANLKQQSLYPTPTGEIYVIVSGFNIPIAQHLYKIMKNQAVNFCFTELLQIHCIFHLIVSKTVDEKAITRPEEEKNIEEFKSLQPVHPNFWKQFHYEYSWLNYSNNIGQIIVSANKMYYLASKIVEYHKLDSDFDSDIDENIEDDDDLEDDDFDFETDTIDEKIEKFVKMLPPFLIKMKKIFDSCIYVGDRYIGLNDLRQISLYPTPDGVFFVLCDGFTDPIPLKDYYHMVSIAKEELSPIYHKIYAILTSLLNIERTVIPDDFPKGIELFIDSSDMDTSSDYKDIKNLLDETEEKATIGEKIDG